MAQREGTGTGALKSAGTLTRDTRKRMSLVGWRTVGNATEAGKTGDVSETTVRDWVRNDPDYRAHVMEALDEYAATVGQLAHNAITEHLEAARRGDMVLTKEGTEGGKPVALRERVALNPALARLALTRTDPRFTHPKTEVEHSGQVAFEMALDAIPDPE